VINGEHYGPATDFFLGSPIRPTAMPSIAYHSGGLYEVGERRKPPLRRRRR
jgi:hypothetical protein